MAFPEPDSDIEQARIYWVYTYGGTLQRPTYVPANGQPNTFTIHNVTDRLGRPVPDGTTVYIANPYWGHFVNQAGGNATAYAINGSSAQVIYSNTQIGGWGYVPTGEHASEGLHLRATLGTTYGTNDSRSWLYPQVEYRFFTYNLP